MKILMYSRRKPPCQFCVRAKSMLDYYGVEYEEKLLDDINHLIEFKDNYPNIKQVPAIFIDDERQTYFHSVIIDGEMFLEIYDTYINLLQ